MKKLVDVINESGNISNIERQYRNFINMIKSYNPNVDTTKIGVFRTNKGNWKVYDENQNKICLISKYLLNNDIIDKYNLRILNDTDVAYLGFVDIVKSYNPKVDMKKVSVKKINDSDWEVYAGKQPQKICVVSKNILDKKIIKDYEIKVIE
jgi:hypothetical protein